MPSCCKVTPPQEGISAVCDASLARVGEHGGTAGDKMPIPHIGWFAHCTDTEGNAFSLWQGDSSAGS